jgi:copper chaperone CopZ
MNAFLVAAAVLAVSLLPGPAVADDKTPKPERHTFRVLGLFAPDREKDLRAVCEELPDITLVGVNFADAEITVEFVPGRAFPGAKPEQFAERLDQKVRPLTRGTFGVKPRRTVPADQLEEVVIPVAGLDCKACCLAAYELVAKIDGVEQATASFKDGRVTARIDPARTDRTKLEDALRKRGVRIGQ